MKTSHATIALCLCMTALASEGSAQPPPAKADAAEMEALTDKARQLYAEGLDALKKSRWAEAHASFLAAWRIKPHYQVASNLGASEVKLGKYRDAAEHLSYYLREAPKTREKERKRGQEFLDEALAKVASVTLRGLPDGAEVKVDGAVVGVVPLAGPLFMEPGAHVIEARLDSYAPASHPMQANEGAVQEVQVQMEKVTPTPPPTATVTPSAAPTVPPPPLVPARPDKGVVIGGAAVTGAALVAAVAFVVVANAKAADAGRERTALVQEGGPAVCGTPPSATCQGLRGSMADQATFGNLAAWSFLGAGVVGAGTLVYALLPRKPVKAGRVGVSPFAGVTGGGVVVRGEW